MRRENMPYPMNYKNGNSKKEIKNPKLQEKLPPHLFKFSN